MQYYMIYANSKACQFWFWIYTYVVIPLNCIEARAGKHKNEDTSCHREGERVIRLDREHGGFQF